MTSRRTLALSISVSAGVALVVLWPTVIRPELSAPAESSYVAKNLEILRSIPIYGGGRLVSSYSVGIPGGLDENGPPYKGFETWRSYLLRPGVPCAKADAFYAHWLRRMGWTAVAGAFQTTGGEVYYRRGRSGLDVSCGPGRAGQPNDLTLHVDYHAYS